MNKLIIGLMMVIGLVSGVSAADEFNWRTAETMYKTELVKISVDMTRETSVMKICIIEKGKCSAVLTLNREQAQSLQSGIKESVEMLIVNEAVASVINKK